MHATHPAYLILDLTAIIIFGEECNLQNSSLSNFPQPPVTSFLLALNVFHDTMFPNNLHSCLRARESFTPIRNNRQNYNSVYFILHRVREDMGRQRF
jgi:hypothetical protein